MRLPRRLGTLSDRFRWRGSLAATAKPRLLFRNAVVSIAQPMAQTPKNDMPGTTEGVARLPVQAGAGRCRPMMTTKNVAICMGAESAIVAYSRPGSILIIQAP